MSSDIVPSFVWFDRNDVPNHRHMTFLALSHNNGAPRLHCVYLLHGPAAAVWPRSDRKDCKRNLKGVSSIDANGKAMVVPQEDVQGACVDSRRFESPISQP